MLKQVLLAHFEPVVTFFGPCKIPKCPEKGPFWDQKWVKNAFFPNSQVNRGIGQPWDARNDAKSQERTSGLWRLSGLATAASSTCRIQSQDQDLTSTLRINEGNTSTFTRFSRNRRLRLELSDDNAKRHTGIRNSV